MIRIAEVCGTCKGSTNALNLVYEIYEKEMQKENPKNICIYKEILHNEKVMEELNDLGIITIDSLEEASSDDIVILRAHGEGAATYEYLKSHHIEYYDATCPKVKKIHEEVFQKYNEGYEIIIVGKKDHPEVIGTNGWCHNEAIIIENSSDLVKVTSGKKKYLTCQTTASPNVFQDIAKRLQDLYPDIEISDATCNAVRRIKESSLNLAKDVDMMFVIGGINSSNTKEIYEAVSNCVPCYKFSDITEFMTFILDNKEITNKTNIGFTGGASTPIKEIYNYKYLLSFLLFYKEKYQEFNSHQQEFNDEMLSDDDNDIVKKMIIMFQDLNQDGKYIRASLIALGYYLTNHDDHNYLDLCYAYEIFQTAILIHDDIIDNARMRRGKETIPRRICHEYLNLASDSDYHNDVLKLANSIAICAGDFGLYEANKVLVKKYGSFKEFAQLFAYYNDIIIKTIKGETIDVALPFLGKYDLKEVTEKDIFDIYHLKTSWYTIIGPFMLGYILGGSNPNKNLENVLNKIGLSFQIKDDLLGIFSSSKDIGKSNTSDIEEFKQTILYSYVINTPYKEDFLKIYGNHEISKDDLEEIRAILKLSGAYDYANSYLSDLYAESLDLIDELEIAEIGKDILKGLLIYINIRYK